VTFVRWCVKVLQSRAGPQILTAWCMRIACWIPKSANTNSEFVILRFHNNNGSKNAPQCYVVRGSPVLLSDIFFEFGVGWLLLYAAVHGTQFDSKYCYMSVVEIDGVFYFLITKYSFMVRCLRNSYAFNPLNAELNPICHLLALLGARPILHISRIRVNLMTWSRTERRLRKSVVVAKEL
jgi:hypothetical protein